jgi:hypothetical protein
MQTGEQCPISEARVGEKATRLVAGLVIATAVLIFLTSSVVPSVVLIGDFLSRAFFGGRFSPYKWIVRQGIQVFRLVDRPVNAAPKVFAGRIGFLMSVLILAAQLAAWPLVAKGITGILALCAGLEAFLGFCVGCQMYTIWTRLSARSKGRRESSAI